jgi:hypothetical protein
MIGSGSVSDEVRGTEAYLVYGQNDIATLHGFPVQVEKPCAATSLVDFERANSLTRLPIRRSLP